MKENGILSNLHPLSRLFLLVVLSLGGALIITFLGVLAVMPIWGKDLIMLLLGMGAEDAVMELKYIRYLQILSHVGLFIIPSLLFGWLIARNPMKYLCGNKAPLTRSLIIGVLIMLAALPLVSFLMEINLRLSLPDFMAPIQEWMQRSEEQAEQLTKTFLNVETWQGLLFNIFMIAVIPAIGEEFIFRGAVLKTFRQWSGSPHLAVWISAIIFSAIHLQFFGFLPRLFLGIVLGYMMIWTGNIWIPVAGHFFNNAMAVVFYYLFYNNHISYDIEQVGKEFSKHEGMYLLSFASIIVIIFLFWILREIQNKAGKIKY